jgi:hypothetical protein
MSIIDNFVDAFCKLVSSDKQIPQKPKFIGKHTMLLIQKI